MFVKRSSLTPNSRCDQYRTSGEIMSTSFSKKINVTDQVDTTVSVYNDKVYAHLQTTKGGKWKSISLTAPEFHKLVKTIPKIAKLIQKAGQKLKTKSHFTHLY